MASEPGGWHKCTSWWLAIVWVRTVPPRMFGVGTEGCGIGWGWWLVMLDLFWRMSLYWLVDIRISLSLYIYIHLSSPYVYRHSNNRFILQLVLFRSKSTTFLFFNFGSLSFSAPWNFNPFEFTTRCFVLKLGEQWIELAAGTPLTCQPATDVLQWVVSHWSFCHVFLFDSEEEQW